MRLGVRTKLLIISALVIVLVEVPVGFYLETKLRASLEERTEQELVRYAGAVRDLVQVAPDAGSIDAVDPLADMLGRTLSVRVTVVASNGMVLGDSHVETARVGQVENHGNRTEIAAALEQGRGRTRRYSTTLHMDMLYVAMPYQREDSTGAVRVAMSLDAVDQAVGQLRMILWMAGLLAFVVALLMSLVASHLVSRTLRKVMGTARRMAAGHRGQRLDVRTNDEIGRIARSLNRMAEEMENVLTALAAERDRMEAVLEGMVEAVVVLDDQQRLVLINASARKLFGMADSAIGRPLSDLVRVPSLLDLVRNTSKGTGGEAEFDLIGPLTRRVLARATPQRLAGGAVFVLHDITRIRHLETVRRDFVANVSHELRTPVSVIQANAETLLHGAMVDPDRKTAFLEAILRNAERLSRLIADLLDLSRIEVGRYIVDTKKTTLEPVVGRSVGIVEQSARRKNLSIAVDLEGSLVAIADPKALEQVIVNLLDNATKYTPENGHIRIGARHREGILRIEVEDDGPGIELHHRERVFERFYRVDPGRSRELGGTGLGLSIVKHLVEMMGGQVGVEPVSPHGSRFWFTVPAASLSSDQDSRPD